MLNFKEFHDCIDIVFVGDIMQHPRQIQYEFENDFKYDGVFDEFKSLIRNSDLVFGNLETTFSGFKEVPQLREPRFTAPDQFARVLKDVGFTHLVLANNHMFDGGMKGFERTKKILKSAGLIGIEMHESISVKNQKIHVCNFTTHLNNSDEVNDAMLKYKEIPSVKGGADFNIVFPHWGGQYTTHQNEEQITLADKLIDSGFDFIIGSGPHLPHVIKFGKQIVAYSLGDFLSAHDKQGSTDKGRILKLKICRNKYEYQVFESETVTENGKSKIKITPTHLNPVSSQDGFKIV